MGNCVCMDCTSDERRSEVAHWPNRISSNQESSSFLACASAIPASCPLADCDLDGGLLVEDGRKAGDGGELEGCLESRPPTELDAGLIYEGQWIGNKREGAGKLTRSDGSQYIGSFKNSRAHGHGVFKHTSGDVYDGNWVNDQACGYGTFFHSDGSSYKGQWLKDLQEGYGVEKWIDGSSFEGDYVASKKQGYGNFHWADGSNYEGQFHDNEIHGEGWYKWADGREYRGQWKCNRMDGKGMMLWVDGRCFTGEFVKDKKEGVGEMVWSDGRRYKGEWLNGKQHGIGEYTNLKGVTRTGEWSNGKRVCWTLSDRATGNDVLMQTPAGKGDQTATTTTSRSVNQSNEISGVRQDEGTAIAGTWIEGDITVDTTALSTAAETDGQAELNVVNDVGKQGCNEDMSATAKKKVPLRKRLFGWGSSKRR